VGMDDFEVINVINAIASDIGAIIAYGGVAAGVAFALFRFLGQKWIDGKFAEKLEAYKHAQNKEIEDIRFKINLIFSRLVKLRATKSSKYCRSRGGI
jgi:hypothetical protein